jgi:hypothetical protein
MRVRDTDIAHTVATRVTSRRQLQTAQGVCCAYVTLEERKNYRHKATSENLGVPWCFTLHWHQSELEPFAVTEDWGRLIEFLREALSAV